MVTNIIAVVLVCLRLLEHGEEYVFGLPSAYARSILTVPWAEMGDKISITCAKTGYSAAITFHTKVSEGRCCVNECLYVSEQQLTGQGCLHQMCLFCLFQVDHQIFNTLQSIFAAILWGKTSPSVSGGEEGGVGGGDLSCPGRVEQPAGVYLCRCKSTYKQFTYVGILGS